MDIRALAEELGLEEADAQRLITTFLESTEQDLIQLAQAYADQDAEQLRQTAHHIKGAAGNLELNVVAAAAQVIEEKSRSGILEDPAVQIKLIRGELDSIRAQLSTG
jgi:HPt (histidine-containing phosphotransfer) domain-containing protein